MIEVKDLHKAFGAIKAVDGVGFSRPAWERCEQMARTLHQRGILTKLRYSAGQDVDGGCGQLRARAGAQAQVPLRRIAVTR